MADAASAFAQPASLPPTGSEGHHRKGAGCLVEHPQLTQLSALLKAIDAGDRIIKGRLELFYCSRRSLTQKAQQDLVRRAPESLTDSPLGPLSTDVAQVLLANLRSLLALLFVDYDCTLITPNDFERCPDKHVVFSTINNSLAQVVDRVKGGFLAEFWQIVQDAIDVVNCDVFAFRPKSGSFEPADNSLMSFHYFFIDPLSGRILFIGCVTKSKSAVKGGGDSDSDVVLSGDDKSASSRQGSSDMGSSLQEGEFVFSDRSGDEGMLD
mmetsp:Transcript_130540/g.325675  ORF Transcript_130540/g.325675 Transcript_130540/m.325675 type:complete len:267 (+) Transcript_130540:145-945(+)